MSSILLAMDNMVILLVQNLWYLRRASINLNIKYHKADIDDYDIGLEGYPHYMLKEIEESTQVVRRLLDYYYDGSKYLFDKNLIKTIKKAPKLVFIAAGTSYHASLIARRYFFNYGKNIDVFCRE